MASSLAFSRTAVLAAVALGVAVPSIAWGRGLVNVFAAVGLVLVFACLWDDRRRGALPPLFGRRLLVALAVVAAAWVPSVALSIAPGQSAETWLRVVLILVGGVAVHQFMAADPARLTLALKALLAAAAAAAVYAALRYGLPPAAQPGLSTVRLGLVFKAASNLFALLVPVALWAGWTLGGRWRWAAALAVAGAIMMLVGSDSRSALAGLLAGALAGALAVVLRRRWWWVLAPVTLLMAGAFWYLFQRMAGIDLDHLEVFAPAWLIDVHRQHIWAFVLGGFADHPMVGIGMGAAREMAGAGEMIPGVGGILVPSHPHNWMVEVLGETGLIGALPLVAVVIGLVVGWLRAWLRDGDAAALTLFVMLTMFFASGLFNFSLWRAYWLIGLIVPYAMVTAARRRGGFPQGDRTDL